MIVTAPAPPSVLIGVLVVADDPKDRPNIHPNARVVDAPEQDDEADETAPMPTRSRCTRLELGQDQAFAEHDSHARAAIGEAAAEVILPSTPLPGVED
eukprot:1683628-Prymnesium_polylepis.1